MSLSFNSLSSVVQFVGYDVHRLNDLAGVAQNSAADTAKALGSVRNHVRDGLVDTWNRLPGNEKAERLLDKATDGLPFNNAVKASVRALAGQQKITLDKDAVQGIQDDPDFKRKEEDINNVAVELARRDPRYGQEEFDIEPLEGENYPLALGGDAGNESKVYQLRHAFDPTDPEIRKTWGVAGNEQTWLLRHCPLTIESAKVAKDGSITINYKVTDTLDLSPNGSSRAYDVISSGMGGIWHGVLDASKPKMSATFCRTISGTGRLPDGTVMAGGTPASLQPRAPGTSFAQGLRGTQPQSGDLTFARMANDVYSLPDPGKKDKRGFTMTGTASEAALARDGWTRMEASPDGKSVVGEHGGQLEIDPKSLENGKTGLRSAIYTDGKGHYVMAFAGTDLGQAGDVLADAEQGTGMRNRQYLQGLSLSGRLSRLAGADNVAFTGHSLGGALAAAASANTSAPAVTFNAAGVSEKTLALAGCPDADQARAAFLTNGQIRSYSVDGDPLTTADAKGLPPQLGARWHAAWHGAGINPDDPRDIIALHGGGGDGGPQGQGYIEIMEDGRFQPGSVANPYVDTALSFLGPSNAARALGISEVGSVGTQARGLLGNLLQIKSNTRSNVRGDLSGGDKLAFLRVPGDVATGVRHLAGDVKHRVGDLISSTVDNFEDQYGSRS